MQNLDKLTSRTTYELVKKPWGGYLVLEKYLNNYWLKKLFIHKGEELSLQSHKNRSEIWIVLKGRIRVQKEDTFLILTKGELVKINKEEKHRIYGITNAQVLEIAFGKVEEEDIIRYQDKYGRIKKIIKK